MTTEPLANETAENWSCPAFSAHATQLVARVISSNDWDPREADIGQEALVAVVSSFGCGQRSYAQVDIYPFAGNWQIESQSARQSGKTRRDLTLVSPDSPHCPSIRYPITCAELAQDEKKWLKFSRHHSLMNLEVLLWLVRRGLGADAPSVRYAAYAGLLACPDAGRFQYHHDIQAGFSRWLNQELPAASRTIAEHADCIARGDSPLIWETIEKDYQLAQLLQVDRVGAYGDFRSMSVVAEFLDEHR